MSGGLTLVRLAAGLLVGLLIAAGSARGDDPPASSVPPALRVSGVGLSEQILTLEALRALPRSKLRASENEGAESEFEGVTLAAILERAGAPLGKRLRGPALRLGVLARAADGYLALFSLAELDPDMRRDAVLLADRRDGADLDAREGPLRIIVAGEGRGARWVRQLIALELIDPGLAPR